MANVPAWITAEEKHAEQEKARADTHAQSVIQDSFKIAKEGPAFWKELMEKLKENTDALSRLNLSGSTSVMTPADQRTEHRCRVQVTHSGADQTYTDLFYMPGSTSIRCWTPVGPQDDFAFVLPSGEIAVAQGTDPAMNASYMAQYLVKSMANHVRRKR
jgi:hypothetical protein